MLGVICHEAGSAEIISDYLISNNEKEIILTANKVVETIFNKKKIKFYLCNYKKCVVNSNFIITGTSKTKLEIKSIILARKIKIKSITFLDHWINYKTRFLLNKKKIFPDQVWVFDKYAYNKFLNLYPNLDVRLKKNYYLNNFKKEIKKLNQNNKKNTILIVTTPISEKAMRIFKIKTYYGFTELEYIDKIYKKIKNSKFKNFNIKLKIHPSEKVSEYQKHIHKKNLNIKICDSKNLLIYLKNVYCVIGFNSMLMYLIAETSKIKVLSFIPRGKIKNILPSKKINNLTSFLNNDKDY